MARNLQLALSLVAKDGASKALRQTMQGIQAQTKANQKTDSELAKSQQQNTTTAIRASRSLQDEYRRASSARSTLGIRSEREIRREIQQTMAAYSHLTRTGTLSANEQSRAFRSMSERVRTLRTELKGVSNTMTRLQGMKPIASFAGAVAGGAVAAGAVVSQPVTKQMDYQQRLAMMANTAFADEGLESRRTGMKEMDSLIRRSVREGGGTKESAGAALDAMLASGTVNMKSADTLLPLLQKYSTSTGASTEDLAQIAIRLKQTFDIKDEDIGKALNMAIASGQAGGFELNDMARWLPTQLAGASNIGMKGLDDLAVLLSLNQASVITAGTKDEAGNNVVNLLGKITSKDAATAASKISIDGKGIDLPGSLAHNQGKGINGLDAFVGIIDKIVANNPAYKKLDAQLQNAKGSERRGIMESQARILEGSAVGEMVADRQALLALIAYRSNRQYAKEVKDTANAQRTKNAGETAGDINFALVSEQAGYKTSQLKNEREFSEMDSVAPLSNALGDISDKLIKYAQEYPELTTAISGATTAIKAMTAAAVAFAGINLLTGGGIKIPGRGGTGGITPPSGSTMGKLWNGLTGSTGRILGKVAAPLALYQGMQDAPLIHVERGDADARARLKEGNYSSSEARMLDAVKARPGLLDAVDEIAGGIKSWWSPPTTIGQTATAPLNPATTGVPSYLLPQKEKPQPINITSKLMLDGREIASVVNEYNGEQFARGSTGGPQ
ncbi:TPA_asm: phage tail tape measure protein [Salmonella enterica subsp. houtenae serovar 45:g,z51:-]|uniref:Phage tail tape measure protein n=1 Tax=Salmonella enterica subsp. houtenae serovar 45:g,z51:- TaxID=1967611 RepID=A0A736RAM6_SALHO|nr:phage tail tape measure protein [Salmonella enterica subsp. houtenae str. CFSAN000557]HAE7766824.1 phage tail tape measure protein [Salmonella enterica subsp. houtenae serovar 45:g,z51:-]